MEVLVVLVWVDVEGLDMEVAGVFWLMSDLI